MISIYTGHFLAVHTVSLTGSTSCTLNDAIAFYIKQGTKKRANACHI